MSENRSSTRSVRLLVIGVVVYAAAVAVVIVQSRSLEFANFVELVTLAAFGTYMLVGGLIVMRRGNAVGLLLVAYGSLWSVGKAGLVTAESLDEAGRSGAAGWAALIGMVAITGPGSWLIAATWLVFPDGRPRTNTDRRLLLGSGVVAGLSTLVSVFATPQVLPESDAYPHPFVGEDVAQFFYLVTNVVFALFFFSRSSSRPVWSSGCGMAIRSSANRWAGSPWR